ncbi:MAG: DUF4442 domain-containing protein [Bacteroidales bacterium]|nr:DUF4442 domain-containing protein [Bacteroidales bacterium]
MGKNKDFRSLVASPLKLKMFFLKKMPMGFISGLRVTSIDQKHASVSVPYNYLTQNPFRSMYFAVQSMAAELSSGVLAISEVRSASKPVSMLVLDMKAQFSKKAKTKVVFTCNDGEAIARAIQKAVETDEGQTVTITSTGVDQKGEVVSTFQFTWTFKTKSSGSK